MAITVRAVAEADVPQCVTLLNRIIAIGGTTAHQSPYDTERFMVDYVRGDDLVCCHVALDAGGRVAGFQWVGRHPDLPPGCGDIASFARVKPVLRGVGTALFAVTRVAARAAGLDRIDATIRADNRAGLGYYAKMGFVDHGIMQGVPLADGTPVDRIIKRLDL